MDSENRALSLIQFLKTNNINSNSCVSQKVRDLYNQTTTKTNQQLLDEAERVVVILVGDDILVFSASHHANQDATAERHIVVKQFRNCLGICVRICDEDQYQQQIHRT